jgi:hypothetical protein
MTVYNGIAVVLVTWFFFDVASTAVIAFFAALLFTICRIDLEATHISFNTRTCVTHF